MSKRDLRGLLQFCMEHTKGEDVPNSDAAKAMSPEDKLWLKELLDTHTVDVIKEFANAIDILKDREVTGCADGSHPKFEDALHALGCLEDWVGQIDLATNFEQLGGFEALLSCLQSPNAELVCATCDVIAEAAQNHDYCQKRIVEKGLLSYLLNMLSDPCTGQEKVKALYAISCSLRGSVIGLRAFLDGNGTSRLHQALSGDNVSPKLVYKSCFFLGAILQGGDIPTGSGVEETTQIRREVGEQGYVALFAKLLMAPVNVKDIGAHEHLSSCLVAMARTIPGTKEQLRAVPTFKETLDQHLSTLKKSLADAPALADDLNETSAMMEKLFSFCFNEYKEGTSIRISR